MTPRNSAPLLWLALPLALFAAGCQKDAAEEAEAAAPSDATAETTAEVPATSAADSAAAPVAETRTVEPAPPPAPVPGTDAAIIEDRDTPTAAAPGFDAKTFAGRYASSNTTLDISADGTYVLNTDGNAIDGTWTLKPGGKKITLDPNSKSETDRQLEIVSNDSLKIVGGATLKRQDDPQ
jgi:hypothetical protein